MHLHFTRPLLQRFAARTLDGFVLRFERVELTRRPALARDDPFPFMGRDVENRAGCGDGGHGFEYTAGPPADMRPLRLKPAGSLHKLPGDCGKPIRQCLELARAAPRYTAVDGPRGQIRDAEPDGNHDDDGRADEVERTDAHADNRPHAAAAHTAADATEDRAHQLAHVFLNRDPRLPAANRNGDLEISPEAGPARRYPGK